MYKTGTAACSIRRSAVIVFEIACDWHAVFTVYTSMVTLTETYSLKLIRIDFLLLYIPTVITHARG